MFTFELNQIDKNWYEGECNAMVGLFPVSYVEILSGQGDSNSEVLSSFLVQPLRAHLLFSAISIPIKTVYMKQS